MLPDWSIFFGLFLRKPLGVAAASPSGPFVASAMGRQLDLGRPGHVLELGAGTGSLTVGLLQHGCPPERLVLIEREPPLVDVLRRKFPGVTVIEGDATETPQLLRARGIEQLATVVSSLPIKWFPLEAQRAVVHGSLGMTGTGGRLIQLTNAMRSPLPAEALGLDAKEVERVWLNFLPVQIWSYRLRATS